jgi:hypothetical protein
MAKDIVESVLAAVDALDRSDWDARLPSEAPDIELFGDARLP